MPRASLHIGMEIPAIQNIYNSARACKQMIVHRWTELSEVELKEDGKTPKFQNTDEKTDTAIQRK